MTKYEVGTLQDIGAQVGDVVEWSGSDSHPRRYSRFRRDVATAQAR